MARIKSTHCSYCDRPLAECTYMPIRNQLAKARQTRLSVEETRGLWRQEQDAKRDCKKHRVDWRRRCLEVEASIGALSSTDDGMATDGQRDDTYQLVERTWINAYARCQELRPDANPEDAVARELVRLRAENQRMRAVVDAATELRDQRPAWGNRLGVATPPAKDVSQLENAVDAFRADRPAEPTHAEPLLDEFIARFGHLSTEGMYTPAVTPGTLTAAERHAIDEVRQMAAPNPYTTILSERGDAALVRAIDKLLAAHSEPTLTPSDIDRLREAYLNLVQCGPQNIASGTYTDDAVAAFSRLRRVIGELHASGKLGGAR